MKQTCKLSVLTGFFCCALLVTQAAEPEPAQVLATFQKNHAYLLLTEERLADLKQQHATDVTLQRYVKDVLKRADSCLKKPPLEYKKIGPRLLHVSRDCLKRTYALSFAWRWTKKVVYAEQAKQNLLTVCAFADWNPSHFLDTAEMSHAVGIGYDWLYDYLDDQTRRTIRAGLIKNGMEPGVKSYEGQVARWVRSEFNWNQVCNSGLIIGALAIADTDAKYAQTIVTSAVKSLPVAIGTYEPDGAWTEGPGYWSYATHYTVYGLAALNTALGTDFDLSKTEGLRQAGLFPIYLTGPTGLYLNFADSGGRSKRRPLPCLFWLGKKYHNSFIAVDEHNMAQRYGANVEHIIWYENLAGKKLPPPAMDKYFRGKVEIATFRSNWNEHALFVGVKAGYNQVNHGHLALGNFELDALGVRWARDLGSDNYNLPGYWSKGKDGRRWSYYRLNSKSHSVPLLGGKGQGPFAKSSFIKVQTNTAEPFAVIDLTEAYKDLAAKTTRGIALVKDRKAVLVQDEFSIETPCEVVWAMTTDAKIDTAQKRTAELTLAGKKLIAKILSPADAAFTTGSAQQPPPEKPNKGVNRLLVRLNNAKGSVRIAVLLWPVTSEDDTPKTMDIKPLVNW